MKTKIKNKKDYKKNPQIRPEKEFKIETETIESLVKKSQLMKEIITKVGKDGGDHYRIEVDGWILLLVKKLK